LIDFINWRSLYRSDTEALDMAYRPRYEVLWRLSVGKSNSCGRWLCWASYIYYSWVRWV